MGKYCKKAVTIILLIASSTVFSQDKKISDEILDEACKCINEIDNNINKLSKNDSIKSCITSSIINDQAKKLMAEIKNSVEPLLLKAKDTVVDNGKEYVINADQGFEEIQNKLMTDCPYLKTLIASDNERHKNSVSNKKKALEYYAEGEKYFIKEEYNLALVEYNKAIKSDPKFSFAWDNLGICYRKLNRHKEAVNCYQKSLDLDPKGKLPLMNMAVAYSLLEDNKMAISTYNKYIGLHPEDPEGYYGIARMQRINKDYENALENGIKAVEIYDKTSSPYVQDGINVIREIVGDLKKENKYTFIINLPINTV